MMVTNRPIAFLISRSGILREMLRFLPEYPLLSWYGVQACPVMSNERCHHVMFFYTLVTSPDSPICLRPDSRKTDEKGFDGRRLDKGLTYTLGFKLLVCSRSVSQETLYIQIHFLSFLQHIHMKELLLILLRSCF